MSEKYSLYVFLKTIKLTVAFMTGYSSVRSGYILTNKSVLGSQISGQASMKSSAFTWKTHLYFFSEEDIVLRQKYRHTKYS